MEQITLYVGKEQGVVVEVLHKKEYFVGACVHRPDENGYVYLPMSGEVVIHEGDLGDRNHPQTKIIICPVNPPQDP